METDQLRVLEGAWTRTAPKRHGVGPTRIPWLRKSSELTTAEREEFSELRKGLTEIIKPMGMRDGGRKA